MSEDKQMTLYSDRHVADLVGRYDAEFESYKTNLELPQKNKQRVSRYSFAITKVTIGSFLALCAIVMVLGSNYLADQSSRPNYRVANADKEHSWVFPAYFMAGVFSVSSVLAFKKAIR